MSRIDMSRIDGDLRATLQHRAATIEAAPDLFAGVERRARRIRRTRAAAALAGSVLTAAALVTVAPVLWHGAGVDLGNVAARVIGDTTDAAPGPIADPSRVTCQSGWAVAVPEAGDGLRYLSAAPGPLSVDASWARFVPACEYQDRGRAVQTFARVDADGTVRAAVAVWADAKPPEAVGPEGRDGPDGIAVSGDTFAPWSWPRVRGVQAQMLTTDHVQVWWTENGKHLSLSASGLEEAAVLALIERLDTTGGEPSLHLDPARDGLEPLTGWRLGRIEEVTRNWYASYTDGSDPVVPETDLGVTQVDLTVEPVRAPWQAGLSTHASGTARVVEVNGRAAVLTDNGAPSAGVLRWEITPGTEAFLMGSTDGTRESLIAFAETLEPVDADDPRIVYPTG